MVDVRAPDYRESAHSDYMNGMKYKDIAKKYDVSLSTVKSWKTRYKWDRKSTRTKQEEIKKECKQKENKKKREEKVVYNEVKEVLNNSELTDKQKLFCIYYIRCFNATKAATKAGYSKDSAGEQGYQLLQKTSIKKEIERLKQNKFNRAMLSEDDIFQKYIDIAFSDITDYIEFGTKEVVTDKGKHTVSFVNLKDYNLVDGTLISEVSQGKEGVKIKLQDKMRALQWLSDRMDLLTIATKQKLENEKAKLELDIMKLELEVIKNGGEEDVIEDDGFNEALSNATAEAWDDYVE